MFLSWFVSLPILAFDVSFIVVIQNSYFQLDGMGVYVHRT